MSGRSIPAVRPLFSSHPRRPASLAHAVSLASETLRVVYELRHADGTCRRGEISAALTLTERGWITEHVARPRVGIQLCVGTVVLRAGVERSARITSLIVEILSDEPTSVVFETVSGSIYTWSSASALH